MPKTKEQISYNMKQVKNKDSKVEILLRRELWSRGLRYRKNTNKVFGHPDIAFIGKKIAVFCDSEFWHGYDWEERKNDFKSRQEFWIHKIDHNMERDSEVTEQLKSEGWTVIGFRGNEIKNSCIYESHGEERTWHNEHGHGKKKSSFLICTAKFLSKNHPKITRM